MASTTDDIAIRAEKKSVLDPRKQNIEDNFHVTVEYEHLSKDGTQWLLIKGDAADRKQAKDYIKSLCNPVESLDMRYPPFLQSLIKDPSVHRKLEKQSGAVILFSSPGILNIMGSDSLSVTLAMSAVEELINKYLNTEQQGVDRMKGPVSNLSSQRLDQELRRLSSSTKAYVLGDDYSHTNDAVKRTILSWMNDSIHDDDGGQRDTMDTETGSSQVQSRTATGTTSNHEFKTPSDFNSNSKFLTETNIPATLSSNQTFGSPISRKSSSSHDVQIVDTPPRRKGSSDIELLSPEVFVARQRIPQSLSNPGVSVKNQVCHDFSAGIPMTVTELEKQEESLVNRDRKLGLPQTVQTSVKETTAASDIISQNRDVGTTINSAEIYGEDYLLAQGLQNGFEEDVIQCVFEKFGKNMKLRDFLREVSQAKSDMERRKMERKPKAPSEKNFEFPKAPSVTDITTNQMLKPDILKDKTHMDEYFTQLTKDFEEEGTGCDMDELKMRNYERQRLLREAYTKQVESGSGPAVTDIQTTEMTELTNDEHPPEAMDQQKDPQDLENKKRKHVNKGAVPRKSRFGPPLEKPGFGNVQLGQEEQIQHQSQPDLPPVPNYSRDSTRTANQSNSPRGGGKGGNNVHQRKGYQQYPGQNFQEERSPSPGMRNRGKQDKLYPPPGDSVVSTNPTEQENPSAGGGNKPSRQNLRYVVIDGSNVAFHHGNHHVFSCKGIEIVVNYFLKRGHTEVTAFVPQWRTRSIQNVPIEDQHLLEDLRKKGYLVYTPCRKVAGKNIRAHDDNFVIRLAAETDGIVVSNDNFRDHYKEKVEWRDVIENRLLMYSFVGNFFMAAEDPLGPGGPSLDEFLLKDTVLDLKQCNKPSRAQSGSPRVDRHSYQDNSKHGGGYTGKSQQGGSNWSQGAPHNSRQGSAGASSSQSWGNIGKQGNAATGGGQWKQNHSKAGKKGGGAMTWQQQQLMTQDKPAQSSTPNNPGNQPHSVTATNPSNQSHGNAVKYTSNHQNKPTNNSNNPMQSIHSDLRPKAKTDELLRELCQIFPSDHDKVQRVLQNHPGETDLNKLSLCIVEIM